MFGCMDDPEKPPIPARGQSSVLAVTALIAGIFAAMQVFPSEASADTAAVVPHPAAAKLTPHRVLYKMTLVEAEQGADISSAEGVMFYRFEPLCDGWEVETRVVLSLVYGAVGDEETVETKWSFSSFETFDGELMSFQVDHSREGDLLEVYNGDAFMGAAPKAGQAKFHAPIGNEIALPSGTVFPARHLLRLLDKAAKGEESDHSVVFDGASIDNPYEVNSIILGRVTDGDVVRQKPTAGLRRPGMRTPGVAAALRAGSDLKKLPTWRFRMAYFPVRSERVIPDFELELDYRSDGIATHILQDFGDFALDLTPTSIEPLAFPDCR